MQQRRHHVVVKLRQLQQIDGRAGLGAVRLVKLDRCLAELRRPSSAGAGPQTVGGWRGCADGHSRQLQHVAKLATPQLRHILDRQFQFGDQQQISDRGARQGLRRSQS